MLGLLFTWFTCACLFWSVETNGTKGCFHITDAFHNYTQKLDHFNPADYRIWNQSYELSNVSYEVGGPVILYLHGEQPMKDLTFYSNHQWMIWAKKLKALVVAINHRYYRNHLIVNNSMDNLQYLSADQALADFAQIIPDITKMCRLPVGTKWITVGGSYGGTLSAWMRYKYPHLVHTAVVSSAPLSFKLNLEEYETLIFQDIEETVKGCQEPLMQGIAKVVTMVEKNQTAVEEAFKLCKSTLSDSNTRQLFKHNLLTAISGKVQYQGTHGIQKICLYIKNYSSPDEGLIKFLTREEKLFLQGLKCIKMSFNADINRQEIGSEEYMWYYQKCNEFGLFKTSKIFKVDISYYFKYCIKLFNKTIAQPLLEKNINELTTMKGGKHIQATRVIYVNGGIDPWRACAILKPPVPKSRVISIPGACHMEDMQPSRPNDSADLKAARQETLKTLLKFLN